MFGKPYARDWNMSKQHSTAVHRNLANRELYKHCNWILRRIYFRDISRSWVGSSLSSFESMTGTFDDKPGNVGEGYAHYLSDSADFIFGLLHQSTRWIFLICSVTLFLQLLLCSFRSTKLDHGGYLELLFAQHYPCFHDPLDYNKMCCQRMEIILETGGVSALPTAT